MLFRSVERDEHDHGERMLLNFGHTIGHAIEQVTGYRELTHGEAVAVGIMTALRMGEYLKLTPSGTSERVGPVLQGVGLPLEAPAAASAILDAVGQDKKKRAGRIHFILLRSIGDGFVHPMTTEEMEAAFQAVWRHG